MYSLTENVKWNIVISYIKMQGPVAQNVRNHYGYTYVHS